MQVGVKDEAYQVATDYLAALGHCRTRTISIAWRGFLPGGGLLRAGVRR